MYVSPSLALIFNVYSQQTLIVAGYKHALVCIEISFLLLLNICLQKRQYWLDGAEFCYIHACI